MNRKKQTSDGYRRMCYPVVCNYRQIKVAGKEITARIKTRAEIYPLSAMDIPGLQALLRSQGFDIKDILVYETCLALGQNPVSVIAKHAELPRSTTEHILRSLAKKGFVSFYEKNGMRYFSPTDPSTLLHVFETHRSQFEHQFLLFAKAIKCMSKNGNTPHARPKVTFFDGPEGLKRIYDDTLTAKTPILAYSSIENLHEALPNYFPAYYRRRTEKDISIKVIFPATDASIERTRHDQKELRESRLIPREYDFGMEINIYDHRVAFMSLTEGFGILIVSAAIAETMRKIYDLAWRYASVWNDALKRFYGLTGVTAFAPKSFAGSNGTADSGASIARTLPKSE